MQFTKEKIVERKLSALQAASYSGAMEIPVWQTRTGMFQSDGTYADVSPEWTEISVGEHWTLSRASRWRWKLKPAARASCASTGRLPVPSLPILCQGKRRARACG